MWVAWFSIFSTLPRERGRPRGAGGPSVEHVIAPDVDGHVGAMARPVERQLDLRRDEGIAENSREARQLAIDQPAKARGDIDVAACENESHGDVQRAGDRRAQ